MAGMARTYDLTADLENYPKAGKEGYSTPKCGSCPEPPFTDEAVAQGIQGTVQLDAAIDAIGRVQDLRVIRRLPAGLTDQAISTVKGWKFEPAEGPDGKAAAVTVMILVTFQLRK